MGIQQHLEPNAHIGFLKAIAECKPADKVVYSFGVYLDVYRGSYSPVDVQSNDLSYAMIP